MKVSVVIPVFNEAGNIGALVKKARQVIQPDDELIVVDDGSTDATAAEVDPALCTLVRLEVNQGKGAAMRAGIEAASGDVIVFMGGDGQDDPAEIPRLLAGMEQGGDLVIGSRFIRGDGGDTARYDQHSVQPINEIGNRILTGLINTVFGLTVTDSQAEFKCIRADAIKAFGLTSRRYEIESEILVRAARRRLKVLEVPVHRFPRGQGVSKLYDIPLGRIKFAVRTLALMGIGVFTWK